MLINDLRRMCDASIKYLNCTLNKGHFDGRSYYGELFTALSMTEFCYCDFEEVIIEVLEYYNSLSKLEDNFHWEFNNYAFLKIVKLHPELEYLLNKPLQYKGTPCTNWTLLRTLGKMMEGASIENENPKELIEKMQIENGLIMDENSVASFQYHCFMTALIYELYEMTNEGFYYEVFIKAVNFIANFTFGNGDTLYVGRGQEQIFGYGALLYVYAIAYVETKEVHFIELAKRVFLYINTFYSEERILPLVLNSYEISSKETLPVGDRRHLGWYSYNNYYDYLPFFTYYLVKTYRVIKSNKILDDFENRNRNKFLYADQYFLRYSNKNFDLAISCRKGASANALPYPYVVYQGKEVTSCYGGEDYFDIGYYQLESIPFPSGKYYNVFFHLLDSKLYLKKVVRSILRKKPIYAMQFLWEMGEHYIVTGTKDNLFEIKSNSKDYNFSRTIIVEEQKLLFKETIIFNKNIYYEIFIPFKLLFPYISKGGKSGEYLIPGGRITGILDKSIYIEKNKYMTCKTMVDVICYKLKNYKAKKGKVIEFTYAIEMDNEKCKYEFV